MEWMLLRLPSQLCDDGGQAVNAPRADWPKTLHGEAAEIYLRWERDLKPYGFGISANVLDFPGGMPGDIGLFFASANGNQTAAARAFISCSERAAPST